MATEIERLTQTVESWKKQLEETAEVRAVVEDLKREFAVVLDAVLEADLPGTREAITRLEAKMNVILDFIAVLYREDKETLTRYREMAKDSLTAGDIFAGRDVTVRQEKKRR